MPVTLRAVRLVGFAAAAGLVLAGCGSTSYATRATPTPASPSVTDWAPAAFASASPAAPTAPTTPVSAGLGAPAGPAIRAGVFTLGDSVMLGADTALVAHHYRVDAKVSRQFFDGITELRAVLHTGTLPRNVVVHLGTNGTIAPRHCEAMVATAGPWRRVFVVTVFGPRSWMRGNDVVLRACAARHPANVVVIDWAQAVSHHPQWLGPDHIHPTSVGHRYYVALIASVVGRYAR